MFKTKILNFTRNPPRRFDIPVGVGTDVDLREADFSNTDAAPEPVDVSPENDIDRQVERDLATSSEEDLLTEGGG